MFDSLMSSFSYVLSVLGFAAVVDLSGPGGATGAMAVTIALVATAVMLHAALAARSPATSGQATPHPLRAIDASTPLPQSDPDAPGHPRPRAPQRAVSAA